MSSVLDGDRQAALTDGDAGGRGLLTIHAGAQRAASKRLAGVLRRVQRDRLGAFGLAALPVGLGGPHPLPRTDSCFKIDRACRVLSARRATGAGTPVTSGPLAADHRGSGGTRSGAATGPVR